jgi:hypothetical protein
MGSRIRRSRKAKSDALLCISDTTLISGGDAKRITIGLIMEAHIISGSGRLKVHHSLLVDAKPQLQVNELIHGNSAFFEILPLTGDGHQPVCRFPMCDINCPDYCGDRLGVGRALPRSAT